MNVFFFQTYCQTNSLESSIDAYFEERLQNIDEETHMFPFLKGNKLKNVEVASNRNYVWNKWKSKVLEIENLPKIENVELGNTSYTIHQWELKKEDPMPFYFIRKGKEGAKKHALFLNLHGSGPKQNEFKTTLDWSVRYDDRPSIYFIPQIPNERRYRWWYKPVQYAWERLFRLANLDESIDNNKVYVMGISEGGYGSQRLAAFYADYLAGAGPMAGGEPLKNAPPLNFRNIAFSLETGEKDQGFGRNKLTSIAKNEFVKLENQYPGEFVHRINLQPDKGHWIDYTVTTPWLVNYNRNSHPKHISWILFPMDGRYRKGFYNIALNKELKIKEGDTFDRILFDIRYEGNTVVIKVDLMNNEMTETKQLDDLDFSLFLDERYIDYSKKVKVVMNEKVVYDRKVVLDIANLVESCSLFGDSERVFPVKIRIVI